MKDIKKTDGLTILEVMIVVVIIGVITTLSVLGFGRMINHQKLVGEANNAVASVKYMTDEARVSKRFIKIMLNYQEDFIIAWVDDNKDNIQDSVETVIKKVKFPEKIDLYKGRVGSTVKSDKSIFLVFDDGKTQRDVEFTIRSEVTDEFRGVKIHAITGWVEPLKQIPSSLRN